jgi:hypothetical protein
MKALLGILFLIPLLFSSCIKNNPDPIWLYIDAWTLEDNTTIEEGALSQQFTDAWVYVDNDLMGVFELPVKIPILKTGTMEVKVFPTIHNNGISATKKIYPFVDLYRETIAFKQNQVDTIKPVTRYKEGLNFWIEDFEEAGPQIENDPNSQTVIAQGTDAAILGPNNGNYYGYVKLNKIDSTWIANTNGQLLLPRGQEIYLEIDFRSTNSIVTGLIELSSTTVKNHINIQLNPQEVGQEKWKKIYIDLKELVSNLQSAEYFEISFVSFLDQDQTTTDVVIDNIKLVHFK